MRSRVVQRQWLLGPFRDSRRLKVKLLRTTSERPCAESRTRPQSPGDEDLTPFSPAWLKSILYSESEPEAKARGKATLARGEELVAEGRYAEAIPLFESVPGIAPKEYKMVQRAYLQVRVAVVIPRPDRKYLYFLDFLSCFDEMTKLSVQ